MGRRPANQGNKSNLCSHALHHRCTAAIYGGPMMLRSEANHRRCTAARYGGLMMLRSEAKRFTQTRGNGVTTLQRCIHTRWRLESDLALRSVDSQLRSVTSRGELTAASERAANGNRRSEVIN